MRPTHYIVAKGPDAGRIVEAGLLDRVAPGSEALGCEGGEYDPALYPELADRLYLFPKGRLPDLRDLR